MLDSKAESARGRAYSPIKAGWSIVMIQALLTNSKPYLLTKTFDYHKWIQRGPIGVTLVPKLSTTVNKNNMMLNTVVCPYISSQYLWFSLSHKYTITLSFITWFNTPLSLFHADWLTLLPLFPISYQTVYIWYRLHIVWYSANLVYNDITGTHSQEIWRCYCMLWVRSARLHYIL